MYISMHNYHISINIFTKSVYDVMYLFRKWRAKFSEQTEVINIEWSV